jgi:glycosyltransferase involved in cell wall biosynthesis
LVAGISETGGAPESNCAIVYFGNGWFGENRTSSHHVADLLSRRIPLLYVDCPGIRAPQVSGRDWKKIWRVLASAFRLPQRLENGMWHMTMPQIPFRTLPFISKLNEVAGRLIIRRGLRKVGLRPLISWFLLPHTGALAGQLGEELVVYYCTDDYACFPGMDAAAIGRMDEDLTRKADQVFVTSMRILERKRPLNEMLEFSPHGVDAALFGQAALPDFPAAEGTAGLRRPVIGFFGLVAAWIDLELIQFLAEQRPDWTFLIIGSASVPVDRLARLSNVVLPGPQPYRTLPAWAKSFDVAIIPYRRNEQVMSANPLKLREYLATGKPIVTVWTPEVERFRENLGVADTPEEFLAEIEKALATDTPEQGRRRMEAVSSLTWEARVEQVWKTVEQRLRAKRRQP